MSRLAQVLIVLVLTLSVGFAVMQILLYGRRENYAQRYDEAKSELSAAVSARQKAQGERDDAVRLRDQLKNQLETTKLDLEADLAAAQEREAALNEQVGDLTAGVEQNANTINALRQDIGTRDEMVQELRGTITDRDTQIAAQLDQIKDRDATIAGLEGNVDDLELALTELKKDHVALAETEQHWRGIIQELRQNGIEMPDALQAPIDGLVVSVDDELDLAVVNVGKQDGVMPNTTFTLYDGANYVAKLVINNVQDELAAGRIMLVADGRQVAEGNRASTRIP